MRAIPLTQRLLAVAALAVATALLVTALVGQADGSSPAVLRVTSRSVEGPQVGYFDFSEPTAYCPGGYVATGGAADPGGTDIAYQHVTFNGRGWEAAGLNTDASGETYSTTVSVVCARGVSKLRVQIAAAADAQAKRDLLARARADH